jgi:hypothetical protein
MGVSMKKTRQFLILGLLGLGLTAMLASCKKGPAEKVGEKIDNAVQDTKDAARDVKDDLTKKR